MVASVGNVGINLVLRNKDSVSALADAMLVLSGLLLKYHDSIPELLELADLLDKAAAGLEIEQER